MKLIWDLILLLLLWMMTAIQAQTSYMKRSYYGNAIGPTTSFIQHRQTFVPLTFTDDLLPEESKRKELSLASSKKYSKKLPYRSFSSEEEEDEDDISREQFSSNEYSHDPHDDSHEYTIGTQIRVQHPIDPPKKTTSSYPKHIKYTSPTASAYKSHNYDDVNVSTEERSPKPSPPKKHSHTKYTKIYEPDPFHVVAPPRPTVDSSASSYNVYEPDQDEYEVLPPSSSRVKTTPRNRFNDVASKKQIEAYLKDQQKLFDDAVKLQVYNDPKFQQYLKSKTKDNVYEEAEVYEPDLPTGPSPPPTPGYRHNFNEHLNFKPTRSRRRPKNAEFKRPSKGPPPSIVGKPKRRFRSALVINV